MGDTAFQTQYRQEFISGFEQRQSLLRTAVTTDAEIKGNTCVFLVADSNNETAVTRGVNGLIPAKADNLTQVSCTLAEWHDLRRRTSFNIFASQGDGRRIMQENSMAVINRKIDSDILTELTVAGNTYTTGAATQMSLSLAVHALTILGNNDVPMDSQIYSAITPAAYAYLMQTKEFASAEYVNNKPFANGVPTPVAFRWAGVNWIVHPNLPGKGTAAEEMYMWHKSAIGHCVDTTGVSTAVGYDNEQDYSFARTTAFMGTKTLQAKGVVIIAHDGSAFASV